MMHWVQAGYTEKALTFADKAMRLIDEHKGSIRRLKLKPFDLVGNGFV